MSDTESPCTVPGLALPAPVEMAEPRPPSESASRQTGLRGLPPGILLETHAGKLAAPAIVIDGQRLRQWRRQHGLSQEKLAHQAGISVTTVARLERQARASCRGRTLGRLAAALGEEPTTIACPEADHGRPALGPSAPAPLFAVANTLPQAHAARGRDE
jgi:hypothetical protein